MVHERQPIVVNDNSSNMALAIVAIAVVVIIALAAVFALATVNLLVNSDGGVNNPPAATNAPQPTEEPLLPIPAPASLRSYASGAS